MDNRFVERERKLQLGFFVDSHFPLLLPPIETTPHRCITNSALPPLILQLVWSEQHNLLRRG
jgi:hypothetical protein